MTFQELAEENRRLKDLSSLQEERRKQQAEAIIGLEADLAAARAALEPFAKIYQGLQNPGSDRPNDERCYLVAPWTGARLTFGHLRAAAEAHGGEDGK